MFLDKSIQLGVGLDTKVIFGSFQRWEWHTQVVLLLMSYSLNHNFDIWQLAKDEKIIEPRPTRLRKNCGLYMNARGLIRYKIIIAKIIVFPYFCFLNL